MTLAANVPDLEPVEEPDLRAVCRDELAAATNPDPKSLTNKVIAVLTVEQRDEAVRYGVAEMLQYENRMFRRRFTRQESPSSAAWRNASEAVADRPDIFAVSLSVPDGEGGHCFRFLRDCDRDDLKGAAELLRHHGQSLFEQADRYSALGRKLRGRAKVGSLRRSVVEEVLRS